MAILAKINNFINILNRPRKTILSNLNKIIANFTFLNLNGYF